MSIGDLLRSDANMPLCERYTVAVDICEVSTNWGRLLNGASELSLAGRRTTEGCGFFRPLLDG